MCASSSRTRRYGILSRGPCRPSGSTSFFYLQNELIDVYFSTQHRDLLHVEISEDSPILLDPVIGCGGTDIPLIILFEVFANLSIGHPAFLATDSFRDYLRTGLHLPKPIIWYKTPMTCVALESLFQPTRVFMEPCTNDVFRPLAENAFYHNLASWPILRELLF